MAIGTTAPITNRAAREGARIFYSRLLQGRTVKSAFKASNSVIKALEDSATSSRLVSRPEIDPATEILHQIPRIVARFARDKYSPRNKDEFDVEIGVLGCPRATNQLVIFTDDEGFLGKDHSDAATAAALCSIVRNTPIRGELWAKPWTTTGDFKIFACGVTTNDDHFLTSAMLCDALEAFYKLKLRDPELSRLPAAARNAISMLRTMDGQQMWALISDQATGEKPPREQ
jgi:hypothetical protein